MHVHAYTDPAEVLQITRKFLVSQPILHNLTFTVLQDRVASPRPGRYWIASQTDVVKGLVFQSPLDFPAVLTPMEGPVIEVMVDAIADAQVPLPGLHAEAATAAKFAGRWTERTKSAAVPVHGLRLYELIELQMPRQCEGELRKAVPADRELLIEWINAFNQEIGEPNDAVARIADQWIAAGMIWLWQCGATPVAMAVGRGPTEGVVRLSTVYTPPAHRNRGYGAACTHGLSKLFIERGLTCMLYTDLGNAASNSIYRQIGYRAVAEGLRYEFKYPL
jgi:predicted GNAT family acetyltransferase